MSVHQPSVTILFLPTNKIIPAVTVVSTSNNATGNMVLVFNNPTRLEIILDIPNCKKPMSADALPIFCLNGASASAVALGIILPIQERTNMNRITVLAKLVKPLIVKTKIIMEMKICSINAVRNI